MSESNNVNVHHVCESNKDNVGGSNHVGVYTMYCLKILVHQPWFCTRVWFKHAMIHIHIIHGIFWGGTRCRMHTVNFEPSGLDLPSPLSPILWLTRSAIGTIARLTTGFLLNLFTALQICMYMYICACTYAREALPLAPWRCSLRLSRLSTALHGTCKYP